MIDKRFIRNNFNDLISDKYEEGELIRLNTGGSTGEPFEFLSDQEAGFKDNAHHWFLYSLMGYEKGDVILACGGFEISADKRARNIFYIRRYKGHVFGDVALSALYLNDENVGFYVDKILEVKPSILRGYPSFFDRLAQYIIENNIVIDFVVKGVNLTLRCAQMSNGIGWKGHSDHLCIWSMAIQRCRFIVIHDKSYVYESSPYYGYVEVLDEEGNDVGEGEVGKII